MKKGDIYEYVKLNYDKYNLVRNRQIFRNLACMDFDDQGDRWVVHYEDEAADIVQLKKSADDIPPKERPVSIASLFSPEDSLMYVDVNSFDRMTELIKFLHRFVDQRIALPTHFQLYNVFSTVRDDQPSHDMLFGTEPVPRPQEYTEMNPFINRLDQGEDHETVIRDIMQHLEGNIGKPLDRVETLTLFYDDEYETFEDEANRLAMLLSGRMIVASEHYKGNTAFSLHDLLNRKSTSDSVDK